MRELALFAGAGGGILGGLLLGWRTVCAVEINPYCRQVLLHRQRDGLLPPFPIWDDVTTFDGKPWRGHIDVISGGFPCQDISSAGTRKGLAGERSGLWSEFARIIGEVRPAFAFVENSPMLTVRGLGVVLGDLAALGYHARWGVLGAHDVGAPHRRDRIWIVATDADLRGERALSEHAEVAEPPEPGSDVAYAAGERCRPRNFGAGVPDVPPADPGDRSHRWWGSRRFEGVDDGVAHKMDRVRATGNGQVPAVVRLAWQSLAPEGQR